MRILILALVALPVGAHAEPAKKLWSCDTVTKMSACFQVEDAELARKSDTGQTGRGFLEELCGFGGGKLVETTDCPAEKVAGTCLKTKALANSFYKKGGAPDHYTFAGHYYASGGHPSDASDEERCTRGGGAWQKGFVSLRKAPAAKR